MAKIHDLFIVELAEVIKGYGNDPDDEDPFRLSEFYRFYELPNIAVSRENFKKMRPIEERKTGKWIIYTVSMFDGEDCKCPECGKTSCAPYWHFCPNCGLKMEGVEQDG